MSRDKHETWCEQVRLKDDRQPCTCVRDKPVTKFKAGDIVVRDKDQHTVMWRERVRQYGFHCDGSFLVKDTDGLGNLQLEGLGEYGCFSEELFHLASDVVEEKEPTYTGGSVDYYQLTIKNPTTSGRPEYTAECNDIIEALGMNYAEGNAFKAIWRRAAQRTLGLRKAGAKGDGLYDAEKVAFFGQRLIEQSKELKDARD